jgi:hypothetical protein
MILDYEIDYCLAPDPENNWLGQRHSSP